jgi:small subunit ribosomal protein S2
MGLAVIGVLDTDCDPEGIDIVIPGNDDALRSVRLMIESLVTAVEAGAAAHRERLASTGAAERYEETGRDGEPRPTRGQTVSRPKDEEGEGENSIRPRAKESVASPASEVGAHDSDD